MRGRPALLGTNATKTQFRTLRRQVLLKSTPHLPNTTQRDIDVGDIILHTNTRMHALVSSLMFPPLCSPYTGTREVFMRGGRMGEERRAMKEKEGKWERGIVVCPHNAAPLFSEVTAGASRTPPPLSKSFLPLFLSSLSLAQGEYPVSSPFIAAEQQTASLKKKKKTTFLCAHFYLPLSNGPFPLRACQIYLILNLLSFSHPFSLRGRLHGWRKHTWLVLFVIWRSHRRRLH